MLTQQPAATIQDLRHGLMATFTATKWPCAVYGIDSKAHEGKDWLKVVGKGTAFGYCASGGVTMMTDGDSGKVYHVREGEYFCMPARERFAAVADVSGGLAFFVWRFDYFGLRMVGGPAERIGRLKYIDGCSDTLLIAPPLKGDPCFNLLHFPAGITQTSHTHPSVRAGLIHGGAGKCVTADGVQDLLPGKMFILAPDAVHAFITEDRAMDLTVFHPDSDFGPTHEEHPMLNRTIVDGVSAKDLPGIRTKELRQ